MTQLNLNLPIIGDNNATEDPKVRTALSDIQTVVNSLDNSNIASNAAIDGSKLANGSIPQAKLALGPTYETSLPGSPVDGQEIYYAADASNGVIWHLRYRSGGGTYKWEFIGGASMTHYIDTQQNRASDTYGDLTTVGPTITAPVNGEYEISFSSIVYNNSNTNDTGARIKLNINGSTLADSRPYIEHLAISAFDKESLGVETVETVTGTRVVKLVYNNRAGSGTANFVNRFLSIRPIRVG